MPDQKISQLADGGAAQAADEFPNARSGANYKITGANIAAAATSVGTLTSLTVAGTITGSKLTVSGVQDALNATYTQNGESSLLNLRNAQNGTAAIAGLFIGNDAASTAAGLRMYSSGYTTSGLAIADSLRLNVNRPGGITISATDAAGVIRFATGGTTERLRLDASGNLAVDTNTLYVDAANNRVGIGTASPAHLLDVDSTADADLVRIRSTASANNTIMRLGISGNNAVITASGGSTGTLQFNVYGSERARITETGAFVIGNGTTNASPTTALLRGTDGTGTDIAGAEFRITGGRGTGSGAGGPITFYTSAAGATGTTLRTATERMRLDSGGNVLVGQTAAETYTGFGGSISAGQQLAGTTLQTAALSVNRYGNAANGAQIVLAHSRGTSVGTNTIVASGDPLGIINFNGANGTGYDIAAQIRGEVDGTPGASADMPGRLVFLTTADASATPTERMRLDSAGNLGLGVTPSAWSGIKAFEFGTGTANGSLYSLGNDTTLSANVYYSGGFKYVSTSTATRYQQSSGQHIWYNAASGTAGNAITFTQAMTLNASGNLLVRTTNASSDGINIGTADNFAVTESSGQSLLNVFRQSSSAATVLANGYKYSATANAFASSFSSSWAKSAISLNNGSILFFANAADTVAAGTDITPISRGRWTSSGNFCIGTTAAGTSAEKVLALGNATEPTTGPADTVQFYSVDRSAGNTIPAIYCEGTGVTDAAITNVTVTNKIAIKVNGTIYYLLATTSAS